MDQHTILISGWAAIVAASRRWYFSAVQVIFVIVEKRGGSASSSTNKERYTRNWEETLGCANQYWSVLKIQTGEFRLDLWKPREIYYASCDVIYGVCAWTGVRC